MVMKGDVERLPLPKGDSARPEGHLERVHFRGNRADQGDDRGHADATGEHPQHALGRVRQAGRPAGDAIAKSSNQIVIG